jgi:rubredoxin
MTALDPLGLRRCAVCGNAFVYDADQAATEQLRRAGRIGPRDFVCRWCAPRLDLRRSTKRDVER